MLRRSLLVGATIGCPLLAFTFVAILVATACHGIRPAPRTTRFPLAPSDTVTYIGHATVLLRLRGATFLTDPLYSDRVAIYGRFVAPGIPFEELPLLDAVLISHGHHDHLDSRTLRRLDKAIVMVVPDGLQDTVRELGFQDVRGLHRWETTTVRGTEITAVPAQHWGTCTGYIIHNLRSIYFAGDTGLFEGMREIGGKYEIDLAILPIAAYRPHLWFIPGAARAMRHVHMAPEDVADAIAMLAPRVTVPIHWGTFKLTGEPIDEPIERLQRVIEERRLHEKMRVVLQGETVPFS